jgi:hypothetical protein
LLLMVKRKKIFMIENNQGTIWRRMWGVMQRVKWFWFVVEGEGGSPRVSWILEWMTTHECWARFSVIWIHDFMSQEINKSFLFEIFFIE